jgi:hypothetical protein
MDQPVLILGKQHRQLFHDYASAMGIADMCYPGDENARISAIFHIELDTKCSSDPQFKMYMHALADDDDKKRKKKKRKCSKKIQLPKVLEEQRIFLDKIQKLMNLHQFFYY